MSSSQKPSAQATVTGVPAVAVAGTVAPPGVAVTAPGVAVTGTVPAPGVAVTGTVAPPGVPGVTMAVGVTVGVTMAIGVAATTTPGLEAHDSPNVVVGKLDAHYFVVLLMLSRLLTQLFFHSTNLSSSS